MDEAMMTNSSQFGTKQSRYQIRKYPRNKNRVQTEQFDSLQLYQEELDRLVSKKVSHSMINSGRKRKSSYKQKT